MKTTYLRLLLTGLVACPLLISSQTATAEESSVSLSAGAGFYSDYMFRGINAFDGSSFQPTLDAEYDTGSAGAFGANLWFHIPVEGKTDADKFTELDATLRYTVSLDKLSLGVGHIWYTFPDNEDEIVDSAEVYLSASYETFLNPTLTVFHDYREYDAQYYQLGLSQALDCDKMPEGSVTPYVDFGFASNAEKIYEDNGLVQVTYGLKFDVAMGDIAVQPSLNYTSKVSEPADNEFWFGVNFGL